MVKSKSFLGQFVSLGIGSFIYLLVGFVGTPIITRLVDPVSYGDYSIFTVYSNIALAICVLGLDQSFVRLFYIHDSIDYRKRLLYACMLPAIGIALALGVAAAIVAFCTNAAGLSKISLADVLIILTNVLALILNRYSTLSARLKYDTNLYSAINIAQKGLFLSFSTILILTIKKNYYMILVVSTIASTLAANMLGIIKERDLWSLKKTKVNDFEIEKRELFIYGIPLMISYGITVVFNALDKLALNLFCSRADVGVYASALNLLAVFSVIRTSFNALWMPSAVEQYEKNKENKYFFQKGNSFITILMLLFGAGMIMCKDPFVMLLGEKYRDAAFIFPFLMFEPIMYTISETTVTGLVVTKKSGYQVIAAVVACITNFVGNWILTPRMGAQGAAISTGISYIVFFAIRTMLANRVYYVDYHLNKFSVMMALLAAFAVYGSNHTFSVHQVIFFVIYALILMLVYYSECKEAFVYAKSLCKRIKGKI